MRSGLSPFPLLTCDWFSLAFGLLLRCARIVIASADDREQNERFNEGRLWNGSDGADDLVNYVLPLQGRCLSTYDTR